jgi:hypothetical protein
VGLHIPWAVETGIIHELILEDRWRNHARSRAGRTNSVWDLVLYEWVTRERRLELFLNTSVRDVELEESGSIRSVIGVQLGNERSHEFQANLFCDATGDGTVAYLAGADYHYGREARLEFGEPGAPQEADSQVLPSSLLFRARDVGRPVPFRGPPWAVTYRDEGFFLRRAHYDLANDEYLWLEVGSPFHSLADNEAVRDEILKHVLGVWDHIKNHCTHKEQAANWALEWVGMVVGKRESRRIEGDYWLREQDVSGAARFQDTVAYGGWFVDHHNPRGIKAGPEEHWIADDDLRRVMVKPYGIPFRTLYAKAVPNLLLAGRCMSATHMALGSVRVQPTLACCGQAAGTAASLCLKHDIQPRALAQNHIRKLQRTLLRDDCFLPGVEVSDPMDVARSATVTASSAARLTFEPAEGEHELTVGLAQSFPVSADRIDTVWLPLRSSNAEPVTVRLGLRAADNCWDFDSLEDLATATAELPPRVDAVDVPFHLAVDVEPLRFYWVYVEAQPGVFWEDADGTPVGCVTAREVEFRPQYYFHGKQRPARSIRIAPASHPFEPENVVGSPGRPECWTNIWISDPHAGFPQAITLDWVKPVAFNAVCLLFDSNLNREFRYMGPLCAPPEIIRDYEIQARVTEQWHTIVHETENRVRQRLHRIRPVTSNGLRVVVHATNGDRSARIYAIRVYHEV